MKVGVSKASPKRTIGEWLTLSGYNCLAIADADGLLKASCTKPSVIVTARCPLVVRHDSSALLALLFALSALQSVTLL